MFGKKQGFPYYGSLILFDTDDKGGGSPASGSGNSDQTNWKDKYETLQAQIASGQYVTKESYVSLQRNLETAVLEKKSAVADRDNLNAKITLMSESESKLKEQLEGIQGELEGTKKQVGDREAKLERHNLIFKEFPNLAPFEADGLLPSPGEGQNLQDVLKAFSDKVTSIQEAGKQQFQEGSTQPPRSQNDALPKDKASILKEATAASLKGDEATYNAKMDEYYKLEK